MYKLFLFFVLITIISCGPRDFAPPEQVIDILEKCGNNRPELEKVIQHFKNSGEVIKEEAAYFLISNMEDHGYAIYKLIDSSGQEIEFDVLNYTDYEALLDGWDDIEDNRGKIHFELDTMIKDYELISGDYLIQNIDLAVDAWENNPWAKHLSFDQFCEFVLPYRSSNEPIEDWRTYFIEELSWVKDSIKDPSDPVEAACLVNDYIKSWFRFDERYYEHPTDQGLQEILKNKMGRCEDMTNLAIYAMRALAIPVMSDFTPYWANTGNNHAWNAILDNNDSVIIFMGGEANPGEYELGHKLAKVYRKTFANVDNSLGSKKQDWENVPKYLGKKNIIDRTFDYVPVERVKIDLTKGIPDSTNFAYICVFNSGEWKACDYTRVYGEKASYNKLGLGVAYLPAFYYDEEIIPAASAFILSDSGKILYQKPDMENKISFKLYSTTKRITKETTDFIEETYFTIGKNYSLYYWDDKWRLIETKKATNEPFEFKNVPSNVFYWLVEEGSRKEERIFTVSDEGNQVWW